MPGIRIGTSEAKFAIGSNEVVKIYKGTETIWESTPQLDTPTNVSISNLIASFNEVENATTYEFFVDGVSIGEKTFN